MSNHDPEAAAQRAIEIAGGASALARLLDITPQAVGQWRVVPPERVLQVERITKVSRHDLRPDVFGDAPEPISAEAAE
jgi:DNA-binding transcriptional regulator YdaS (Cro superfamily)